MYQLLENKIRKDKVGFEHSNSGSEVQCSTTELFVLVTLIYKQNKLLRHNQYYYRNSNWHPLRLHFRYDVINFK